MAETEIRFKRNGTTLNMAPHWGVILNNIARDHNNSVFDNSTGAPELLTSTQEPIFGFCEPWVNMKNGQFFIDALCVNPFIEATDGIQLQNRQDDNGSIIHKLTINYDSNTLLINNNNQLSVNTNAIVSSQVPLFTYSDKGSVRASNNIITQHNDSHWLGESNYWHRFSPLHIQSVTTAGTSLRMTYAPCQIRGLYFNQDSFFASPSYTTNEVVSSLQLSLKTSTLNTLGGIKLSCGNILNATIPTTFGSIYYPIGVNNQNQAFAIFGHATNLVPGVVNLFGSSRSGIAIGENSILTDDISIDEQTLIVDLTEFSNYRVFEIPSGTKTFDKLVIYISKETVATEYIIVLDNRNNTEECIINSYEIATRDLELKDTFLPKDEVLSLEPQGWMFLKCNVVHQSTRDEHYAFLTL